MAPMIGKGKCDFRVQTSWTINGYLVLKIRNTNDIHAYITVFI